MPINVNDKLISWATDIDPETIRQAEKTARLPITEGYVALMPDAHVGIGATVGSVIPTKNAVIPSAVGVDSQLVGVVTTDSTSAPHAEGEVSTPSAHSMPARSEQSDARPVPEKQRVRLPPPAPRS